MGRPIWKRPTQLNQNINATCDRTGRRGLGAVDQHLPDARLSRSALAATSAAPPRAGDHDRASASCARRAQTFQVIADLHRSQSGSPFTTWPLSRRSPFAPLFVHSVVCSRSLALTRPFALSCSLSLLRLLHQDLIELLLSSSTQRASCHRARASSPLALASPSVRMFARPVHALVPARSRELDASPSLCELLHCIRFNRYVRPRARSYSLPCPLARSPALPCLLLAHRRKTMPSGTTQTECKTTHNGDPQQLQRLRNDCKTTAKRLPHEYRTTTIRLPMATNDHHWSLASLPVAHASQCHRRHPSPVALT